MKLGLRNYVKITLCYTCAGYGPHIVALGCVWKRRQSGLTCKIYFEMFTKLATPAISVNAQ